MSINPVGNVHYAYLSQGRSAVKSSLPFKGEEAQKAPQAPQPQKPTVAPETAQEPKTGDKKGRTIGTIVGFAVLAASSFFIFKKKTPKTDVIQQEAQNVKEEITEKAPRGIRKLIKKIDFKNKIKEAKEKAESLKSKATENSEPKKKFANIGESVSNFFKKFKKKST